MGNNITQKLKYKESVIKFSYRYGVTKAAIRVCESVEEQYIGGEKDMMEV